MDIPGYISSGILESYVLGLTTPEESMEVETYASQYPAIRIELNKIEDSVNDYASLFSKTPADEVREKIFASVGAKYFTSSHVKTEIKTIQPGNKYYAETKSSYSWLSKAASILLFVSAGYNYYQYQSLQSLQLENSVIVEDLNSMNSKFEKQLAETERIQKNLEMLMKPGIKMIEMKGMEKSPASLALIYWNQNSKEVYLNVQSLPEPPADMQYQLWAIVADQPVDLGVFDSIYDKTDIHKMNEVSGPSAFAITLEKKGGSTSPTMEEMYVMGKNG